MGAGSVQGVPRRLRFSACGGNTRLRSQGALIRSAESCGAFWRERFALPRRLVLFQAGPGSLSHRASRPAMIRLKPIYLPQHPPAARASSDPDRRTSQLEGDKPQPEGGGVGRGGPARAGRNDSAAEGATRRERDAPTRRVPVRDPRRSDGSCSGGTRRPPVREAASHLLQFLAAAFSSVTLADPRQNPALPCVIRMKPTHRG